MHQGEKSLSQKQTKKKIRTYIAVILLAAIAIAAAQLPIAEGNFTMAPSPIIDFYSPASAPYIYRNTTVDLAGSYLILNNSVGAVDFMSYSLDGANSVLPVTKSNGTYFLHSRPEISFSNYQVYSFSKPLQNLYTGNHKLTLSVHCLNGTVHMLTDEEFIVDTTFVPPTLTVISPQNQTYNTRNVPLTYSMNSNITWTFYSLDAYSHQDENWTNPNGNMTLTNLQEGKHKLDIAVKSEEDAHVGELYSTQTVYFTVGNAAEPDLFNGIDQTSIIIVVVVAAAVVVGLGLALMLRKRRQIEM
jgi:hypothetical protein